MTELSAELQKVVEGERLPGAYIVKHIASDVLVYTVSKGFPLNLPEQVCQDLVQGSLRNTKVKDIQVSCLPPIEVELPLDGAAKT